MSSAFVTLNTGASIPAIGLGCWSGLTDEEHDSATPWIVSALQVGCRHLDTAHGYGTERAVGRAIREAGIPRADVFVTTKLPPHHHPKVAQSLEESLANFGFDYFDLYLMHWPQAFPDVEESESREPSASGEPGQGPFKTVDRPTFNETWADMEKLLGTGKVKAIGVSNFSVKTLTQLLTTAKVVPAVNQIEMHPHQAQPALLEFAKENGIVLTAYSSTGYDPVRNDPTIVKLAEKYAASPAQIALAWHVARGTTAATKTTKVDRQKANLLVPSLPVLSPADVELISTLHKDSHLCNYPGPKEWDGHKVVFGWTYEQMGW